MLTTQDILQAAGALPSADRVFLIEALLISLDPPTENSLDAADAWRQVATARLAELNSGQAATISWDEMQHEGVL